MAISPQKITPCLWFDRQAKDAANFCCSVFDNSRITLVSHYGEEGYETHGMPAGSVMVAQFALGGPECETFEQGRDFMQAGWTGTFDKLGRHLADS